MIEHTDYPKIPFPKTLEIYGEWLQSKENDIATFRDKAYTSLYTGITGTPHHTPWLEEKDDSIENFLGSDFKK